MVLCSPQKIFGFMFMNSDILDYKNFVPLPAK